MELQKYKKIWPLIEKVNSAVNSWTLWFVKLNSVHGIIIVTLVLAVGGIQMKKTKVSINTKIKYTDSSNYQKHFCLDDRVTIQRIITENRDEKEEPMMIIKNM